jgi:hypothetical protein
MAVMLRCACWRASASSASRTIGRAGLDAMGLTHAAVGGADIASELDAKRAIERGTRVVLAT